MHSIIQVFETDSTFEDNQTKYEAFDSGSGYSEDDIKVYRHLKYDETKEGVKVNNDNSNYSSFTQELKILDGIETIGTRAFGDNHSILEVKLESSTLKTIGKDAFNRCTKAGGGLTIPKTVTSIGRCAFKQYGENTDNPGTLTVLGYSDSSSDGKTRYIGIPLNDINGDPKPIFPSAKFKDVVIGGTEEEATVNAIGDKFMNNMDPENNTYNYSGMTGSLTIGKSIKSVGREAFVLCTGFNGALTLNEGLTSIGENAFNACAGFHGDLLIPSTVSSIGTQAFKHFGQGSTASDANTGSLTILGYSSIKPAPDDSSRQLQTIDSLIFSHAHFTNVTIGGKGGNVQYIGENFMENETTETFNDEPVTRYNGVRGNLTIGEGVYRVGKNAFLKCKNFDGALKIADSVWQIGESAFNGCSGLYTRSDIDPDDRKLVISSHVTQIGDYAFKSVCENLNDNFPSLEIYGASGGEANMKSIGGPGKNGVVVKSIFANSRFNNVTIGEENGEVKMIGDGFMDNSNNEYSYITGDLVIGKSVTKIGANAFYKLESDESKSYNRGKLVLNEGLQSIGEKAFANTRFFGSPSLLGERREERVLKIPKTVTTIGSKAFENFCSDFVTKPRLIIEGYSENDNNKTLGKNIFPGASFENVTIGGSVRHIDGYAFMGSEYSDITGTLTIEEYTVGWVNGRYETLTNNAQLLWWALSSGWTGAGMSFDTDSRTGHGPFRGCNFFKARFPRSLYNSLNSYKDNIFNTKPSVKSWDSNNNIYYASPGFSFEYY
ncbi:leucine-rich repeat protein [Ruminococcus sp. HUN007]|uniref:leucine-rich repeat protein n=1 Tax=Ruminococcus sp. HUN007 TaxID=1514668 RepID=UPI0005D1556C|nr:leucine-rich repeat protein [Ruminococcus sp. HUN007]